MFYQRWKRLRGKDIVIVWEKKKVKGRFHCIFKSKEHELVFFICTFTSMTLVGAYYLPEELK